MINTFLSIIAALFSLFLAGWVLFRDWRSFVHRVFAAGMITLACEAVFMALSFRADFPSEMLWWQYFRVGVTAFLPGTWLLFALSFGRENHKEVMAKWRWVILAVWAIPISMVTIFKRSFFEGNPVFIDISSSWVFPIGWSGYLFFLCFLVGGVLILMNLERTLRASTGRMRWQIKFMVLGMGGFFAARIYTGGQTLLFNSLNTELNMINVGALVVADILVLRSVWRAPLFNINFYLSQSILYNSISVLIVGVYFIVVGLVAKLATYLNGGQALHFQIFFVFLAFLGIAVLLLSDRLREKMRRFIIYNFKRPKYDYRKEWASFTEETASVMEIKDLCAAVSKMIAKTLNVLSVTIWLLEEKQEGLVMGGSTVFSEARFQNVDLAKKGEAELIRAMQQQLEPVDLEFGENSWAADLQRAYADYFEEAHIRYCVPLIAGGNLVGLLTLDDRVGDENITLEDFDLLKTIAGQTAANLLNMQLARRLRQMKEMEAFQTVSAFIMHDFKNLASTLSLTMQNLPMHFDNPEFRKDAVRITQQSLTKINNICAGLSSLSQKIDLKRTKIDLNELVANIFSSLNGGVKASLTQDLRPLAKLFIDPEQVRKVLANLIQNANEAVKNGGEIQVSTEQRDGWVILSVSDNGCGMSKEFMERSLFRPFKTTKKQGMGIGLFQSKMIIEAHGGRIEVESEEGRGTSFRVFLPIAGK